MDKLETQMIVDKSGFDCKYRDYCFVAESGDADEAQLALSEVLTASKWHIAPQGQQ